MADLPRSRSGKTAEAVARMCAQKAGRVIMASFPGLTGERRDVLVKGRGNFLTEADLAAERATLEILREEYPDHEVLAEEESSDQETGDTRHEEAVSPVVSPVSRGGGWMWVVDPLDGTHNFSQGIPYFAFSIALCYQREPVLGLTFAPATGEEFFARKGGGLTVRGKPARASTAERLGDCVLGVDLGYDDARASRMLELVAEVWPVQSVRVMGSAALGLAYAACGRYDLFMHNFLYPWDVAAGLALVREGGGVTLDRGGGPATIDSEGLIAGAPKAVEELLARAKDRPWRG